MAVIYRSGRQARPDRPQVTGPPPVSETLRQPLSIPGLVLALVGAAGLTASIALLYLGMQPIMDVGGFVAVGGPYEIAHPAPEWVMLIPVSIWCMFIFGGLNLWTTRRNWSLGLIPLAWVGLFGSLGWNFLRNGVNPPVGEGLAWGWVISGVVFWLMALVPLLFIGSWLIEVAKTALAHERQPIPPRGGAFAAGYARPPYVAAQALGIAAGVVGAIVLFASATG